MVLEREVPRFINAGAATLTVCLVTGGGEGRALARGVPRFEGHVHSAASPLPSRRRMVVDSVGGCARSGPRLANLVGRGGRCRCTAEQPSSSVDATARLLQNPSLLLSPSLPTLSLSLSLGYPSVNDLRELTHRRLSPLVLSLSYRLPEPSSPSPLRSSSSSVPSLAVRALQFVYIGAGLLIAIDSPTVPSRPVPFGDSSGKRR